MKIILYYFSGTGNTKVVVDLLSDYLNAGHECKLYNIDDINKSQLTMPEQQDEMIGLAYPIYGGDTPHNVYDFVKMMPEGKNNDMFILNTAADFIHINDNASKRIIKILKTKSYRVFYERTIAMGSNFFLAYPENLTKQLYETAKIKVKHIKHDILNKNERIRSSGFLLKAFSLLAYKGEAIAAKHFGKKLRANENCVLCGKCVRRCPRENISIENDMLVFSDKCIWCMRCLYECPQQAIKPGIMKSVVLKKSYNIQSIIQDESIPADYVNENTKGFYRHFLKYMNDPEI